MMITKQVKRKKVNLKQKLDISSNEALAYPVPVLFNNLC